MQTYMEFLSCVLSTVLVIGVIIFFGNVLYEFMKLRNLFKRKEKTNAT